MTAPFTGAVNLSERDNVKKISKIITWISAVIGFAVVLWLMMRFHWDIVIGICVWALITFIPPIIYEAIVYKKDP